ncbi:UNVERIFIED_CONTAM: hypothetical protein FKN15_015928 [Acipenser sinensis]
MKQCNLVKAVQRQVEQQGRSCSAAQTDRCFGSNSSTLTPVAYSSPDLYNPDLFIPGALLHHANLLIRSSQLLPKGKLLDPDPEEQKNLQLDRDRSALLRERKEGRADAVVQVQDTAGEENPKRNKSQKERKQG